MAMARRAGSRSKNESAITRDVNKVFGFVRAAEFEILCVLFIIIAFIIFKDLVNMNTIYFKGGCTKWVGKAKSSSSSCEVLVRDRPKYGTFINKTLAQRRKFISSQIKKPL